MYARVCQVCGHLSDHRAHVCWVCYNRLPAAVHHIEPPPRKSIWRDGTLVSGLSVLGWMVVLFGLAAVVLLVAIELAVEWPGLLIPFALSQVVMFGALARILWTHSKQALSSKAAAPGAAARGAAARGAEDPAPPEAMSQRLVFGISIALAVVALLFLLAIAAVIIFFIVCWVVLLNNG